MKYYLYMEQEEEGCDYSIGCGAQLVEIEVTESEVLEDKIRSAVADRGFESGCYEARRILLFANPVDVTHVVTQLRQERLRMEAVETRRVDEVEFERLRQKLGK